MIFEILGFIFSFPLHIVALECYVCKEEEGNHNDCIRTTQTCEPLQDNCQSIVQYKSLAGLAERRAFVTKGCTTMSSCQMTLNVMAERCFQLKTRDWICSYCCSADRCNYYVPGGASRKSAFPLHITLFLICLWNIVWKVA
ncbi:hypothetical protein MN116_008691 [Schistosoma mekongi]|uniref:UPAR/Ly6 domain-containing protein n=1 Tax=Schistosoma mekongi TaxID=38744 RepID=A0AAE1Z5R7_SCHME|nr:hypothetical protein MN116_008691 [Schistosoma mekongi]